MALRYWWPLFSKRIGSALPAAYQKKEDLFEKKQNIIYGYQFINVKAPYVWACYLPKLEPLPICHFEMCFCYGRSSEKITAKTLSVRSCRAALSRRICRRRTCWSKQRTFTQMIYLYYNSSHFKGKENYWRKRKAPVLMFRTLPPPPPKEPSSPLPLTVIALRFHVRTAKLEMSWHLKATFQNLGEMGSSPLNAWVHLHLLTHPFIYTPVKRSW